MDQHAVGNLLIVALWELLGDHVDRPRLGRPAARRPGPGAADGRWPRSTSPRTVRGADPDRPDDATPRPRPGRGRDHPRPGASRSARPRRPARRAPRRVAAVDERRLGGARARARGSPACMPHLLVPELPGGPGGHHRARRCVVLNLEAQPGETEGFAPETHLEVLSEHAPGLDVDVVLADRPRCATWSPGARRVEVGRTSGAGRRRLRRRISATRREQVGARLCGGHAGVVGWPHLLAAGRRCHDLSRSPLATGDGVRGRSEGADRTVAGSDAWR